MESKSVGSCRSWWIRFEICSDRWIWGANLRVIRSWRRSIKIPLARSVSMRKLWCCPKVFSMQISSLLMLLQKFPHLLKLYVASGVDRKSRYLVYLIGLKDRMISYHEMWYIPTTILIETEGCHSRRSKKGGNFYSHRCHCPKVDKYQNQSLADIKIALLSWLLTL